MFPERETQYALSYCVVANTVQDLAKVLILLNSIDNYLKLVQRKEILNRKQLGFFFISATA